MDGDLFCFGVNFVDGPVVSNSQAIKPFGTGIILMDRPGNG